MPSNIRVLLAKVGLDGHDRGVKIVARCLRDAGMDVVYTGLHRSPDEVVAAAVQEDVDVLGVSLLSGAHMTIFPKIIAGLKARGVDDMILVGGGVMGTNDVMVASNAPQRPTFDDTVYFGTTGLAGTSGSASGSTAGAAPPSQSATSVWRSRVVSSSPVALPGAVSFSARALCAPESAVDGWELVEAAPVSLGARAQTSPAIACPANKALLAAGVAQRSDNLLDMVANRLSPQQNTLNWAANIQNRNTVGGSGAVNAVLAAVCVRRQ